MQSIASAVESSGTRRQLTANLDLGRYRYCDLGKSQVQMIGQRIEGTGSRRTQEASDVIFGGRGAKWVCCVERFIHIVKGSNNALSFLSHIPLYIFLLMDIWVISSVRL